MADREFLLKIVGDVTGATKALDTLATDTEKASGKMSGALKGVVAAVSVGAVVKIGKDFVDAASAQEQSVGALHSVYGELSDEMDAFGKTTAENMGISRAEWSQSAATMGALFKNAGVPLDETAESTKLLSERAADLASMYGGTVPEAMDAMKSAMKGEMDPLERYGVSLKAASIEAKAIEMGLTDAEGKVTDYGKAMATQALIMEQSADAQGNFAKESGTVAGQTERMKAQFKDLQADLGAKLLPILTKLASILRGLVGFVMDNQGWLLPLGAAILGIVVAVKAWQAAQVAWTFATQAAAAAQVIFNAAMAMNPIGLIVLAVAALVAGFIALYKNVDWFREIVDQTVDAAVAAFQWLWDFVQKVFGWIKDNWPLLLAILTGPFGLAVLAITKNWDTIKEAVLRVFNWIKENWPLLLAILTGPFGLAVLTVVRNWDTILNFFRDLPGKIVGFLATIASKVTSPFTTAKDRVVDALDAISDWFRDLPGRIGGFFTNLSSVIKSPFTSAFNAIKSLWNSTVGGFGFSVPSWIPGVGGKSWKIPMMAAGGIVTRPTIALIGEAGPEAVVPLGRGPLGGVTINVYALTASAEVGRQVWNSLREYERTTGKSIA